MNPSDLDKAMMHALKKAMEKEMLMPSKHTLKLVETGSLSHALMTEYGWISYRTEGTLTLMAA